MKVGLQLFSVRNSMAMSPLDTIEKVIKAGYKYIEMANHHAEDDPGCGFPVEAGDLNKLLNRYGAKVVNSHLSPINEKVASHSINDIIRFHKAIGNNSLTSAMEFFFSKDDIMKKCELYNQIGKTCKEQGVDFLYHNHFHEFQQFDGRTALDLMAENTDPEYVKFEIDTYWAMRGGQDPVSLIRKLGKRVKLIHQKDFPKNSKENVNLLSSIEPGSKIDMNVFWELDNPSSFTEIGTGIMDIQSIIDAANETGIEYIILEQDYSKYMEFQSLQVSMDSFKKYSGISFE
jgi:sugar phosphate isomerase/epimerase